MIITHQPNESAVSKPEMEMVEQQKQEYKLLGQFMRTKGLRLYAYDSSNDKMSLVKVSFKNTITINDNLEKGSMATEECTVDSRNIHFEALNDRTAQTRIDKFKIGKIKDLGNLKKPTKKDINFF